MTGEIWAFVEPDNGQLTDAARELCGVAEDLARRLGASPAALALAPVDEPAAEELAALGIERVYLVDDPALGDYNSDRYVPVLADAVRERQPRLVAFSHNTAGRELAPYLAACLDRPVAVSCSGFEPTPDGALVAHQVVYGGRAQARIRLAGPPPYFITVRERAFGVPAPRPGRRAEITRLPAAAPEGNPRVRRSRILPAEPATVDLTEAEYVVAGGLGFSSQEEFQSLWRLADLLGASVGVTRPLVDNGWAKFERQIGTTGRSISPKLYIACGISGATQHVSGIVNPGAVVAINVDPGAPIFQMADLGLVGDVRQVLPEVIRRLEEEE